MSEIRDHTGPTPRWDTSQRIGDNIVESNDRLIEAIEKLTAALSNEPILSRLDRIISLLEATWGPRE